MSVPLASVLMTAHNREKFIGEAIESILASSFRDFELIIVDDGSKDRTLEIARKYLSDPRVQAHANETNLGDYPNRNRAASLARGKYLKYVDSDDMIYPYGLEVMVSAMEKFPDAAMGIERPPNGSQPYPFQVTPKQAYGEHFLGRGLFDSGPTGVIMRTSSFRETGGFSGKRYIGDVELWLKLGARWPVVKLPLGLIWWRQHSEQEIMIDRAKNPAKEPQYLINLAMLNAPDCPLSAEERARVLKQIKRRHARSLLRFIAQERRIGEARRLMRATDFRLSDLLRAFSR